VTPPDEDVVLGEVAAVDPEAVAALLAHAAGLAGGKRIEAKDRGGHLDRYLAPPPEDASDYYVRIPEVVALLVHLRPVLTARLAHDDSEDDVIVSFFRHHVRLRRAGGAVTEVLPGGPMQGPASLGGAGVAPDRAVAVRTARHRRPHRPARRRVPGAERRPDAGPVPAGRRRPAHVLPAVAVTRCR
jgi:hypothetical protein